MAGSGLRRVPRKKPRADITHTCWTAKATARVGVRRCGSVTKRIICGKNRGPTSDVRSEFVVVAVQQAVQDVRDVTLVDFGGQDPRLVGHLVIVVGLEGAAGRERESSRFHHLRKCFLLRNVRASIQP